MKTLEEFFTSVKIGQQYIDYLSIRGQERFGKWLLEGGNDAWTRVLSKFVLNPPLTYWDDEIVGIALTFLESNPQRTFDAVNCRNLEINNGIDNLLRTSKKKLFEDGIDLNKASDILLMAHEIHPEYLFLVEHIFGNLLAFYWSVMKKGGVDGRFDLLGAVNILKDKGAESLISGYDDKIRNAIAHGQVYFMGVNIQYGERKVKNELAPFEFFDRYDLLWRTTVSLTVALLLFLVRNKSQLEYKLPFSINRLLASTCVERTDFLISDYMTSEVSDDGFQLHVLVETANLSRGAILKDCIHFAVRMWQLGEVAISRMLFDVEYQFKTISGLLVIDFAKLKHLLEISASIDGVSSVIVSNLLWFDEKTKAFVIRNIFRNLKSSAAYGYRVVYFQKEQYLPYLPIDLYRVKQVNKMSAGGIPIIEVKVVVIEPSDADNHERIRRICRDIVKKYKSQWVYTNQSKLAKRPNFLLPPKNIRIYVYKKDGPVRWLGMSGWPSGVLVCVAEYIKGRGKAFVVKEPDQISHKIRYQFSAKFPTKS